MWVSILAFAAVSPGALCIATVAIRGLASLTLFSILACELKKHQAIS